MAVQRWVKVRGPRPRHPGRLIRAQYSPQGLPAPGASERTESGLGWWEGGRAGLVRKAMLPGQGAQSPLLGVFAPWPPADFGYSCSISLSSCLISSSLPGSRRQFSIESHCRQRGSDENISPLLLQLDGAAEDSDVVIGGIQGYAAEHDAASGLEEAQTVEAEPEKSWGPPAALGALG